MLMSSARWIMKFLWYLCYTSRSIRTLQGFDKIHSGHDMCSFILYMYDISIGNINPPNSCLPPGCCGSYVPHTHTRRTRNGWFRTRTVFLPFWTPRYETLKWSFLVTHKKHRPLKKTVLLRFSKGQFGRSVFHWQSVSEYRIDGPFMSLSLRMRAVNYT